MKIPYEQLVKVMESVGWTVEDFEEEQSRQFYDRLEKNPPPPAEPTFIIYDEGPEPDDYPLSEKDEEALLQEWCEDCQERPWDNNWNKPFTRPLTIPEPSSGELNDDWGD